MLILHLSIVLLLILVNGFFAMAEIALVSARPARLKPLADGGNRRRRKRRSNSRPIRRACSRRCRSAITIIAVLLRHLRRGDAGRPAAANTWRAIPGLSRAYAHAISMAVVVIGISYFSLILGELVPKRIALLHPERIAAALARFMRAMARVGSADRMVLERDRPIWSCACCRCAASRRRSPTRRSASCCARGWRPGTSRTPRPRSSRWRCGSATGGSSAVMTPRTQIELLDLDDPEEENRRKIRDSAYSRFPVVQGGSQQRRRHRPGQGPARRLPRRAAVRPAAGDCGRRCFCRTP